MRNDSALFFVAEVQSMDNEETGVQEMKMVKEQRLAAGSVASWLQDAGRQDTASYVAALLVEIRKLAVAQDMRFLVYLVEMAFQEAHQEAQREDNAAA